MSERLPYEQHLNQQWTEVPLPDENMAWADMKRRLEEDDDDGFFFWWRPGCGIVGLLLVLLGLGWWLLRDKEGKKKDEINKVVMVDSVSKKRSAERTKASMVDMNESGIRVNEGKRKPERELTSNVEKENKIQIGPGIWPKKKNASPAVAKKSQKPGNISEAPVEEKSIKEDEAITNAVETAIPKTDSTVAEQKKPEPGKKKPVDSPSVKKPNQPDSSKPKSFFFSAGLSVQQQLPIAGQKASPYNSLGRKGSLLDYIPSVYVRLNRKDKWFLQAEFKYGAPQYNKEILYHQVDVPDTIGGPPRFITSTANTLKKSFYHQLPFSFNYFVKPNWSVGGGLQWNKFYGAVSDQQVTERNVASGTDQVLSKGIVVTKSDSAGSFEKSYFQGVFETQYRWKRFSFGARYTFGLQPYLTITLPNQPDRKEKNSNILVFLRYELWRQKK